MRAWSQRPRLFCYPFGHISEFLHDDWLPRRGPQIGLDAAFGDGATPVTLGQRSLESAALHLRLALENIG